MPKRVKLKDERSAVIRSIKRGESVRALRGFINEAIRENTYVLLDELLTLAQEKTWLASRLAAARKNAAVQLVAESRGRIVASASADRKPGRQHDIVSLGIIVARGWRGVGLGEAVMRALIAETKKKLRPRIIFLTRFESNERARRLYEKLGFREIARLPKWTRFRCRLEDEIIMRLQ